MPTEVYDHPANLFVASFIGNPGMNLIPCQPVASGNGLQLQLANGRRVAVTDAQIAYTLTSSGKADGFILGVHPEDLLLRPVEASDSMPVEVYSFEPLGAETIVEVNLGKNEAGENIILKSRVEPTLEVDIGQKLWMGFASERIHIFDADTGKAL
jgi:ABC-type sugar transport system ATPase subunit